MRDVSTNILSQKDCKLYQSLNEQQISQLLRDIADKEELDLAEMLKPDATQDGRVKKTQRLIGKVLGRYNKLLAQGRTLDLRPMDSPLSTLASTVSPVANNPAQSLITLESRLENLIRNAQFKTQFASALSRLRGDATTYMAPFDLHQTNLYSYITDRPRATPNRTLLDKPDRKLLHGNKN